MERKAKRIGIYPGTFDPVHVGHIAFALQALESAKLDYLYFLPERRPRRKGDVTHYGHRVAMLRRAIRPHARFGLLDVPERHFTVVKTLPGIRRFVDSEATLVFLFGSDVATYLPAWPYIEALTREAEFCIGLRSGATEEAVRSVMTAVVRDDKITVIHAFAADVSSSKVRRAIHAERWAYGVLRSVYGYAKQEWLYV